MRRLFIVLLITFSFVGFVFGTEFQTLKQFEIHKKFQQDVPTIWEIKQQEKINVDLPSNHIQNIRSIPHIDLEDFVRPSIESALDVFKMHTFLGLWSCFITILFLSQTFNFRQRSRRSSTKSLLYLTMMLAQFEPVSSISVPKNGVTGTTKFNIPTPPGFTRGSFEGVDSNGGIQYRLQIEIPPGTAKVAPELSIVYHSSSDDGLLGVGWQLQGISTIYRVGAVRSNDNFQSGVSFNSNDRYLIDGARLMNVTGSYGADNVQYETQERQFSRVQSIPCSQFQGPCAFRIFMSDGHMLEYGLTPDSQLSTKGVVLVWLLNRRIDRFGNYMSYSYRCNNTAGTYYPLSINYTGNTNAALNPYNSISFEYESRPDFEFKYVKGAQVERSQRLSHVRTWADNQPVLDYQLKYSQSPSTGRSRLISLQKCSAQGDGACLQPISIDWTDYIPHYSLGWNGNVTGQFTEQVKVVDVNADGRMDFVSLLNINGNVGISTFISNGSRYQNGWSTKNSGILFHGLFYEADLDGNGKTDILQISNSNGLLHIDTLISDGTRYLSNWSMTFPNQPYAGQFIVGDTDSDGISNLLVLYPNKQNGNLAISLFGPSQPLKSFSMIWNSIDTGVKFGGEWLIGDVNRDGFQDLIHVVNNQGSIYFEVLTSNGISFNRTWTQSFPKLPYGGQFQLGDFNSDGNMDLVQFRNVAGQLSVTTFLSSGVSFLTPIVQTLGKFQPQILLGDLNGDAKTDFIQISNVGGKTLISTFISSGTAFNAGWSGFVVNAPNFGQNYYFVDTHGDGKADILQLFNKAGNFGVGSLVIDNTFPDLIANITDGLGIRASFHYDSTTNPNVYKPGNDAIYPDSDVVLPMHVATKIKVYDSTGSLLQHSSYKYGKGKMNLAGDGFLGFASFTSVDELASIVTSEERLLDRPFGGKVIQSQTTIRDTGVVVASVSNVWDVYNYAWGSNWTYIVSSEQLSFELDGSLVSNTSVSKVWDPEFGNCIEETSTISWNWISTSLAVTNARDSCSVPLPDSTSYMTITQNTFENDDENWIIGLLSSSNVTAIRQGQDPFSRFTTFEYYNATGSLKQINRVPGTNFWKSDLQSFDQFGNLINVTVSAANGETRSVTSEFDSRGQFVQQTINSLGQIQSFVYDNKLGVLLQSTDENNLTTISTFDSFGRLLSQIKPDGTSLTKDYGFCSPSNCAKLSNGTIPAFWTSTSATASPQVVEYFDEMSREVRRSIESFNGSIVFSDTIRNNLNQVVATSLPYFWNSSNIYWNRAQYDALNRVYKSITSYGAVTLTFHHGLTVVELNPLNQSSTAITDPLGNTVQTIDSMGGCQSFAHNSANRLLSSIDPVGNVATREYDLLGNVISQTDPDLGTNTAVYNTFGEMLSSQDANNNTYSFKYDLLGRRIQSVNGGKTTSWIYDKSEFGIGKLTTVFDSNGNSEVYSYNSFGKLNQKNVTLDGTSYSFRYGYDFDSGLLNSYTYPSGFSINNVYNERGYLTTILDNITGMPLSSIQEMNNFGQVTHEKFGNGVQQKRTFDHLTTQILALHTKTTKTFQSLSYNYDTLLRLDSQSMVNPFLPSFNETYYYDDLNRVSATFQPLLNEAIFLNYDATGNIIYKSDVGNYTYGNGLSAPHAVSMINDGPLGQVSYKYDAGGRMISDSMGSAISWTSFDKPTSILKNGIKSSFSYDPQNRKYKQSIAKSDGSATTTTYVDSSFQIEQSSQNGKSKDSSLKIQHYITTPTGLVLVSALQDNTTVSTFYIHQDRLGSPSVITDITGHAIQQFSFDVWGLPRVKGMDSSITDYGFTGHDQLYQQELIDMNARLYDPVIARFLSADTIVQTPEFSQSWNRYTYVFNNPLSFTDPTGHWSLSRAWKSFKNAVSSVFKGVKNAFSKAFHAVGKFIQQYWKPIVVLGLAVFSSFVVSAYVATALGSSCLASAVAGGAAFGFTQGFAGTLLNGGRISDALIAGAKGAAQGAAMAGINYGIGSMVGSLSRTFKLTSDQSQFLSASVHGLSSGALAEAQGQKFGPAFVGSFVSSLSTPWIEQHFTAGTSAEVAQGFVGGVVSKYSGGSFASGFVNAYFTAAFNDALHPKPDEALVARLKQMGINPSSRQAAYIATQGYPPGTVGWTLHRAIGAIQSTLGSFGEETIGDLFTSKQAVALYSQPLNSKTSMAAAQMEYAFWSASWDDHPSIGAAIALSFRPSVRNQIQLLVFSPSRPKREWVPRIHLLF